MGRRRRTRAEMAGQRGQAEPWAGPAHRVCRQPLKRLHRLAVPAFIQQQAGSQQGDQVTPFHPGCLARTLRLRQGGARFGQIALG